jgi:uncharacterized protein (TIGR03067 family)
MRLQALALASAALLALAPAPPENGDADAIKGIWAAVSTSVDGVKQPDDPTRGPLMLAFDGTRYVQRLGEAVTEEGTYELGSAKGAKTIDLTITKGADNGQKQVGIYSVSENSLTLCVSMPGEKARPKGFESRTGALVVMKRYRP